MKSYSIDLERLIPPANVSVNTRTAEPPRTLTGPRLPGFRTISEPTFKVTELPWGDEPTVSYENLAGRRVVVVVVVVVCLRAQGRVLYGAQGFFLRPHRGLVALEEKDEHHKEERNRYMRGSIPLAVMCTFKT